ncbi:MAG: hypothetical protein ACJ788_00110 [Ktedonobacteraceae bacterium]
MARENFTNFATTTLLSPNPLTIGGTSFTVAASGGASFPTSNFYVTVDTEIMFITSRTGDTFTVGTRGYDSSTATTHALGATVQNAIIRQTLYNLWSNVPDTYIPEVPPVQLLPAGTPSSYDNEFESNGSWTLFPSPGGGTTFATNPTSMPSYLVFQRGNNDNSTYYAYVGFTLSSAFTITMKYSDGTSFLHTNTFDQSQVVLFVTDQANPTSGSGNILALNSNIGYAVNGSTGQNRFIQLQGTHLGPQMTTLTSLSSQFMRVTYDGSVNWICYYGDGLIYWLVASQSSFLTAPQSLGVKFTTYRPSGTFVPGWAVVDYIRVANGVLPPWGN